MRRFVLAGLAAAALVAAPCGDASAQSRCAKGEVWGDLGCQPKAQSSPMTRAAKELKARLQRTKPVPAVGVPTSPAPMLD
jgi:hypothetical protein